jgi:outer membrane protein
MKIIKQGVVALTLSLVTAATTADVLGLSAAVSYWQPENSGHIQSGADKVDVESDLGLGDEEFLIFTGSFEHPVPLIPNVRFQFFDMDQVAHSSVSNVDFDGQNFDGRIQTSLDLTHYDFTLYYEVLDNWVNLDVGLTAKVFDGELILREQDSVNGSFSASRTDIDEIIPMLYGSASFEFPITSLSAGVEGSAISLSGDTVYDLVARLRYQFGFFGAEVGYRAIGVEVDDVSGIDVDTTLEGPYLSALLLF